MNRIEAIIAAIRNFGKSGDTEQRSMTAEKAADVVNEKLPESISGRKAVMEKRRQMEMIDKMFREI